MDLCVYENEDRENGEGAGVNTTRKVVYYKKFLVVYYESIKREVKIRCIYECRCDERLQSKTKEFTRLAYTSWYDFALRGGDENSIIKYLGNVAVQSVNTRLNSHKDC
jgi:hypothetical protein